MAVATSGGPGRAVGAVFRLVLGFLTLAFRNLANLLTSLRLAAAVPLVVFLLEGEYRTAFWVFLLAAVTDVADGLVAKWVNGTTSLGAVLDPVADKLFLGSLFVTLVVIEAAPVWLAVIVVGRDLLIAAGAFFLRLRLRGFRVEPLVIGKICTLVQLVYGGVVLGRLAGIEVPGFWETGLLYAVAVMVVASALAYLGAALRYRPFAEVR